LDDGKFGNSQSEECCSMKKNLEKKAVKAANTPPVGGPCTELEMAYLDGRRDGDDRADSGYFQSGRRDVSERARVLVEATMHAVAEDKKKDAMVLFNTILDYLALNIPNSTRRNDFLKCMGCGGLIDFDHEFYVVRPGMRESFGPFCDSECMARFYEKTRKRDALNIIQEPMMEFAE